MDEAVIHRLAIRGLAPAADARAVADTSALRDWQQAQLGYRWHNTPPRTQPSGTPAPTVHLAPTSQPGSELAPPRRDTHHARRLSGWQRQRRRDHAQWRATWKPPTRYKIVPPADVVAPGPKFLAAWIQFLGTQPYVADISTSGINQHVDVLPNEVLMLPFAVASYLLATQPTLWTQTTVYPAGFAFVHDSGTGLDTAYIAQVPVWGAHIETGFPYFDADEPAVWNEGPWRLFVVNGTPYLSNDYP